MEIVILVCTKMAEKLIISISFVKFIFNLLLEIIHTKQEYICLVFPLHSIFSFS